MAESAGEGCTAVVPTDAVVAPAGSEEILASNSVRVSSIKSTKKKNELAASRGLNLALYAF